MSNLAGFDRELPLASWAVLGSLLAMDAAPRAVLAVEY